MHVTIYPVQLLQEQFWNVSDLEIMRISQMHQICVCVYIYIQNQAGIVNNSSSNIDWQMWNRKEAHCL